MTSYNTIYKLVPGMNYCNLILSNLNTRSVCESLLKERGIQRGIIACTKKGKYCVGYSISNAVRRLFNAVEKKSVSFQVAPISLEKILTK